MDFDGLIQDLQNSTAVFLGLLCLLAFVLNAVLLAWLVFKKSAHGLARCPRCGRQIACPHCEDE